MKIIDFHTHIYPDKIAERATVAIGNFYNLQMERVGSLQTLLENSEKAGIDRCVVHSVATSPKQVETINDFIKAEVDAHPDRLSGFGTLHQDYEDKIGEAQRIMDMGLKGIKLHPDTQMFNVDDERMLPLYDFVQGKLPVLLHCGDYRYDFSHPRRVARICRMFPKLTVIGAHFGGWSVWEEAYEYLKDTNCMLDTSSSSALTGPELFEKLIHAYGADRLLFGTDFPMWDSVEELKRFMNVRLTNEEREKILFRNAENLLNL
ncbi:MAG: amidohydrolase family protein [Ruminococcus sp.]|nr:amidohydrolase family protein [Ruminococcus sp.]